MTDPMHQLRTALAGQYVIERELGRGGMATVHLARDLKHERFVALKTLRPEIAAALGSDRFLREIKLAARLQHPNILPVYDSGDAGGVLYYMMPFVEGESLRDRLDREIQLPLDDALRIAAQVAEALAYAHDHDVVHRDIKPENIMLAGGHAVVTDFGIARAITAAGGDKLTETGIAIGTAAYMSPEQAAGRGQVDRRSDVYSLGCVVYEMLAGQPPFSGPTAQAIMARHSLDSVPRLRIVREAIPDALEAAIKRALAKVPADRYQTAAQFAEALQAASTGRVSRVGAAPRRRRARLAALVGVPVLAALGLLGWALFGGGSGRVGAAGLDPRRIAVLYFDDLSRDGSLGHVADGLTEGLIAELARVRALGVVSANGVAPYRDAQVTRDSIADALQVGSLIEGSVEPVGAGVRATVRLVDGTSGADIERASFTLPAGQLLQVRDSMVGEAARLLRHRVGDEVELRERRAGTASPEAWGLVLRAERARKVAEAAFARWDPPAVAGAAWEADSLLARAERADPAWVEPVALRAAVALLRARGTREPDLRLAGVRDGLAHAERALGLEPGHAAALATRGMLRHRLWLWRLNVEASEAQRRALLDSAHADLQAAVRADPTLATAHFALSDLYHTSSHLEDVVAAVLAARQAYEADAYLRETETILDRLFWGSHNLAQFGEARRWCDEGGRRFPGNWRFVECQLWLLWTPGTQPDVGRAWGLAARADSLTPEAERPFYERVRRLVVAGVLGRAGLRDSAERVITRARTTDPEIDATQELPGYEALARAQIGDSDGAIALLKRYVVTHPDHSFQAGGMLHWWWRDLERHPEFAEVLRVTR